MGGPGRGVVETFSGQIMFRMIMSRSGGGAGTMPKPQLPMIAVVTPSEVFSGGRGRPDRKRILHADEEPQLARPPHHRLPDEIL